MTEQNLNEVLKVRREKLQRLRDEGNDPYKITKFDVTAYARDINEHFDEYEDKAVSVAGRIMAKRGQGKVGFYDLLDSTDRIQLFLKRFG